MRIHRGIRLWIVGLWIILLGIGGSATASAEEMSGNPEYRQAFKTFYDVLAPQPMDLLVLVLDDQIGTMLMTGGHINAPDNRDRIEAFEGKIYTTLTRELCPSNVANLSRRETISLRAISNAFDAQDPSPHDRGTLAAVLVRILERSQGTLCNRSSFQALGS